MFLFVEKIVRVIKGDHSHSHSHSTTKSKAKLSDDEDDNDVKPISEFNINFIL